MSNKAIYFDSVFKSEQKMTSTIGGDCYERCKAMRPLILKLLRLFHAIEKDILWGIFIQGVYKKITMDFLPVLKKKLANNSSYPEIHNIVYLKKFEKNLLKLKKKCEDASLKYYNYLPGEKLPLEVRSHIVSFISPINLDASLVDVVSIKTKEG
jgi:hypothetical protein